MKPSRARSDPTIASLVVHNLKALTSLADTLKPAHEYTSLAGSQLARFKLWSASLGAHRATGNRALEYHLRDASSIKNQILSLLQDLSTVLDQAHVGVHEQPDQLQDDLELNEIDAYFLRDDSPTQSSLDRSLAVIGHILDCLLRLCITISNPAPHDQFQSRAGAIVSAYYEPWDVRHVQEKFRDVDPIIAERLGRAITIRRQYFRYRKEHHDKLSDGLGNENDIGGDRTTIASSIPEHLKDTPRMTTLLEDLDNKSEFSATSYAPSNAETDQLRVPLIPAEHLEGPFLCPFCQMIIELETRRDWKKHVFRDLEPYICTEKSCSTPARLYSRRSEWIKHMGQEHWRTWSCAFGCAGSFTTRETWHKHMRDAHSQEISSTELSLLEAGSVHKELSKVIGNCPLCVTENIRDSRHYSTHIGDHLESLALFSLPRIEGNDDTDEGLKVRSDPEPEVEAQHEDASSSSSEIPTRSLVQEALRRHAEKGIDSDTETPVSRIVDPSTLEARQQLLHALNSTRKELKAMEEDIEALAGEETESAFEMWTETYRQHALLTKERADATEKAKKEIDEARQAVERATLDLMEKERQAAEERKKEEAAAIARAQQIAQDQTEIGRRADEKQIEPEAEAVTRAQQAACGQTIAERTVDEEGRKRNPEPVAAAEAAATSNLEAGIKGKEEAEVVTLRKKMHKEADIRRLVEGQAKLWTLSDRLEKEYGKQTDEPGTSSDNLPRQP